MTGQGHEPAAGRRVAVHVLPCSPGVPVIPAAALFGAGGGPASWDRATRSIFGRSAGIVAEEFVAAGSADRADVLLHPHDALDRPREAEASSCAARKAGRPIALFSASDAVAASSIAWGTLWRASAFRSRLRPHERIAAGEVPDLVYERRPGDPAWAAWSATPTLGFIGHVAHGLRSLGYLRRGWQHYRGFTLRETVLRAFERSGAVDARFVRRASNLGPPMAGVDVDADRRRTREEYVGSVFACGYSLCMRGAGNWSFRFFETLSAGRIPVLVDTDSALPLEDRIDWSRHVCRIPFGRLRDAPEALLEFHRRLGPGGFAAMQASNRELWLRALEPSRFIADSIRSLAPPRAQA